MILATYTCPIRHSPFFLSSKALNLLSFQLFTKDSSRKIRCTHGEANAVEAILDWKRYPLIYIGEKIDAFPQPSIPCFSSVATFLTSVASHEKNNFYLLIRELENISILQKENFPEDQIILFVNSTEQIRHSDFCLFEKMPSEKAEDFRLRLQTTLEIAKQKKIDHELLLANENNSFNENEGPNKLSNEMKIGAAHLAHALCIALKASPQQHTSAIRACLQANIALDCESESPADQPLENLVKECAFLILQNTNVQIFRLKFRKKTSLLNFKLKTELKNAIDRCCEHLWEGHSRAA